MRQFTERQKEIIKAAMAIISSGGVQQLTIKTLSKAIGFTEGAVYRHFKNKSAILTAIADLFRSGSTEKLDAIVSSNQSSIKKIETFFLGRCKQFSQNRGLMVMFSEDAFKDNKRLTQKVQDTIKIHQQLLIQIIKAGQERKMIRDGVDPEHLFMMIMGALRLLVARWRAASFNFNLEEEGKSLWDSIQTMISSSQKEDNK